MAGSVIGALRVNLGLDSAQFVKGAANAQTTMQKMSLKMIAAGAAITAAVGGAAFEMVKLARNAINVADEISKSAVKIGIGTEELSRLRYAADLSGVSFEQLEKGLLILNRNMAGIGGESKKVSEAFAMMGIETRNADGSLKSSTEVLKAMADVFKTMPDGAQKSALAMAVLGKSGADMIPLINGGSQALQDLTDEADKFGIVIDQETGLKAEAFNDNLTRLRGIFEALATRIAAQVLPALVEMTNWLVANQDAIVGVFRSTGELIGSFYSLGQMIGRLATAFQNALSPAVANAMENLSRLARLATMLLNPLSTALNLINRVNGGGRGGGNSLGNMAGTMFDMGRQAIQSAKAFQSLGLAASDTGQRISGGVGGGAGGASRALRQLSTDSDDTARRLQSLMDRLFPAVAEARKMREEMALLGDGDENSEARYRLRTEGLGAATVSKGLLNTGPIVNVTDEAKKAMDELAKKAEIQTVRIADSFAQMSQRVVSSLQGLTNSIRSGDFLGILSGVLDVFTQLGGAGAFGGGVQSFLNRPIPGYANGTKYARGGLAMVGERGPELVSLNRGAQVLNNRSLGGGGIAQIVPSPYFDVVVDGRIVRSAPAVANAGAMQAQQMAGRSARRRVR